LDSSRRIRASRANGARARGPVTPEGKRRSSQNAISHGLLARSIVLENESPEAFETLFSQHIDRALHNLFLLRAASPSPPAVVDILPAPNPGIPNEPSPISGHLPEGEVLPPAAIRTIK